MIKKRNEGYEEITVSKTNWEAEPGSSAVLRHLRRHP